MSQTGIHVDCHRRHSCLYTLQHLMTDPRIRCPILHYHGCTRTHLFIANSIIWFEGAVAFIGTLALSSTDRLQSQDYEDAAK